MSVYIYEYGWKEKRIFSKEKSSPYYSQKQTNNTMIPQMKIWSSHLQDNLSNYLMNLKNSDDSTGFEPMTSAMPVRWSNQLSFEVTQLRAGQFVGLMFSRERNVVWKKCYMKCGVWNQMKIWSSHLQDNLSNCLMNLKNSHEPEKLWFLQPTRTRVIFTACDVVIK